MALERLGPVAASPDGKWLAVVIVRAMTDAETYLDFPFDEDRADIWLVERVNGGRRNITKGVADGSGYWNPVWSPDGKRLALLSTKGGDNVRPYVYEVVSGRLERLTERGAELEAVGDEGWPSYRMVWLDSTTLLCPVRAEASAPSYYMMSKVRSYSIAEREWGKATKGKEPTASVLTSGRELQAAERPQGALIAIDVASGATRIVAKGNVRRVLASPTQRSLAVIVETGRIPPRPQRRVPNGSDIHGLRRTRLAIVPLKPDGEAMWVREVFDPKLAPGGSLHSWSPDGSSFAVICKGAEDEEFATRLSVVAGATGVARWAAPQDLEVAATNWSTGGTLLTLARRRPQVAEAADTLRFDWWAINQQDTGGARKLTAGFETVPLTVFQTARPHTVIGVASGALWSLDVQHGTAANIAPGFGSSIEAVVWPTYEQNAASPTGLIVRVKQNDLIRVRWDRKRLQVTPVPRPSTGATLVAYEPEQRLAVFAAVASKGTFLWTGDGTSAHFERRLVLNEQLSQIDDAKRILIKYRGIEGDTLAGLVMLPIGYQQGKRYPLITYVYAGLVVTDTTLSYSPRVEKQFVSSLNLHLLTSRGYAVLLPSMPLAPVGQASDPWVDLPKGVLAAVDKVIDLGIADPEQLGLLGHSYGGYSTYALVTYTHRFKAAVAMAGWTNLASAYGTYFTPLRYDNYVHEDLFEAAEAESGQTRMGAPPWRNLTRYLHNSPLYYVDRVQTPLMIVQGDLDYIPMQQSEELFTALYRLGKEAVFVRYWGEGHIISSPANIRDLWQRIFSWFDGHLDSAPRATSTSADVP